MSPSDQTEVKRSAARPDRSRERREVLLFELDRQRYALPLGDVDEVVRAVAVRSLPSAPAVTLGVIDLRGELLPVMNLRVRFALPDKRVGIDDHFVIARADRRRVALHVDRAIGIDELEATLAADATNLPQPLRHIAGIAASGDGLVLIHALTSFLTQAEAESLDGALESAGSAGE
jgi:purine-binding chemotaxis protein CheW